MMVPSSSSSPTIMNAPHEDYDYGYPINNNKIPSITEPILDLKLSLPYH